MSESFQTSDSMTKIVRWKVYLPLKRNFITKRYKSTCFEVGSGYFEICVTENVGYPSTIDVHLISKTINSERTFKYDIGIKKSDGSVCEVHDKVFTCTMMYPLKAKRGSFSFRHKDIFNEDGSLIVVCKIHYLKVISAIGNVTSVSFSKEVSTQTESSDYNQSLSENFKNLLGNSRHADVRIKVGRKEFQAHKSILAARSPVLNSMFSNEMLEKNTGVLNISDTDEDTFEAFLFFLYSGKIDQVPSSKVKLLYEVADKYDLQELRRECVKRFVIEMSVDLVCDALIVSNLYDERSLLDKATEFFIDNWKNVIDTANWMSFYDDHPQIGSELYKGIFRGRFK